MRLRHGALSIDVPGGWSDESTLLFVAPPTAQPALPTTHDVVRAGGSVLVSLKRSAGKAPLDEARAIVAQNLDGLRAMNPALIEHERATLATGLGVGATSMHTVVLGGVPIRQLEVVVVVGTTAVCAIASCGEEQWATQREALVQTLASLSISAVEVAR